MTNPVSAFMDKAKDLHRNPLGIIALFISLIYGFACLVLGISINNLQGASERLPLIWFIILFPIIILVTFAYLVTNHHKKLYAPSDYRDENNFISTYNATSAVSSDLGKVQNKIQSLVNEKDNEHFEETLIKISDEIQKIKEKSEKIPINSAWNLNHWGSNYAKLDGDRIVFSGSSGKEADGVHINLNDRLEFDHTYEISCFAKSDNGTTAKFQLWCTNPPDSTSVHTAYKTPATEGERFKLHFRAPDRGNIRIHLQYQVGAGRIEISDVRISDVPS